MNFKHLKAALAAHFARNMANRPLFRVDVASDVVWETYLAAFPEGANPIFRQRREYDCSCCRHFIRSVGAVVTIAADNKMISLWDFACTEEPGFQPVVRALSTLIHSRPIDNLFLHPEATVGTDRNFEQLISGEAKAWDHFFLPLPTAAVCKGVEIGPRLSEARAAHDVLMRSLTELTDDAVQTVQELIGQNALYRGEEQKGAVNSFHQCKQRFASLPHPDFRDRFVWLESRSLSAAVSKIRNTSIGTLLIDLSAGVDLEAAVRKYEAVMAPANYKRPTALVTKKQVEAAKAKLDELGLIPALERQYARLEDITVNDILFADRSTRSVMNGDVFEELVTKGGKPKNLDRVDEVPIDLFIREILPRAETVEIMVENRHVPNLVSLIAPVNPSAPTMFKWPNRFSWSYNGDLADSIRERVKRAGGNVTGEILCRLAWHNFDDLDLHMREPGQGYEIYFPNKGQLSPCGGMLDVDMNAGGGTTREPVENIFYARCATMCEGRYELFVHQFCRRETRDVGFEVEFEFPGGTHRYVYSHAVMGRVDVVTFNFSRPNRVEIVSSLPSTSVSKQVWGLKTQEFHRARLICLSPNYWGERTSGNKHFFFMLEGCRNDGTARGFYNEFLNEALTPHRKVIEMVGSKMRAEESENQLSGVGFSSTVRNDILARVKGSFTRVIRITF